MKSCKSSAKVLGDFLVIGSTETKSEDRKKNNEQLHLVVARIQTMYLIPVFLRVLGRSEEVEVIQLNFLPSSIIFLGINC
jgi:hypothetical protein